MLVSAFSVETETQRSQAWLAARTENLAISPWVFTEFAAAVALKLRAGRIAADVRDAIVDRFDRFLGKALGLLPIEQAEFRVAAGFAARHELGVRSGDAPHLAICAAHGATLCTLDRRLAAAGPLLGVPTELV